MRVHDRGDGAVVDMAVAFGDVFNRCYGFFFCFVGEHGAKGAVTDDADVGDFGAVLLVDDYAAFVVHIEAGVFESKAGGVRAAADCYQNNVGVKLDGMLVIFPEIVDANGLPSLSFHLWRPRLRA